MADRRQTRYAAFYEAAAKPAASRKSPARRSPARAAEVKREESKSPVKQRKKSASRKASKSPARKKSPVKQRQPLKRSTSRGRPATKKEKEESPERKPSRTAAPSEKRKKAEDAARKSTPKLLLERVKAQLKGKKEEPKTSPKKKSTTTKKEKEDEKSPEKRRSARQEALANDRRSHTISPSLSHSVADASPEEYSDEEVEIRKPSYKRRAVDKLKEFGGPIGCLLIAIAWPALVYALHTFCTRSSCQIKRLTLDDLKPTAAFFRSFSRDLSQLVLIFLGGVTCLDLLPLGRVVKQHNDRGYAEYQFNGLALALLSLLAVGTAEFFKYDVVGIIYRHYSQLLLLLIGEALIISVLLHLRSRFRPALHWNPYAKTGSAVVDWFVGREINPRWFSVIDVKLVHYHISLITALLLNAVFVYKNLKFPTVIVGPTVAEQQPWEKALQLVQNVRFDLVPLVISSLLIIYLLDLLVCEHHLVSSFELQYEGVGGGALLRYALFPFTFSLIGKYAYEHRIGASTPWYIVLAVVVIFLAALVVKRLAIKLKHDFRSGAKLKNVDTLPTFQGRRLLVDSWWKIVRQPNYTADIVCQLALLPLLIAGGFALPPLIAVLINVVVLVQRAVRVNRRNANRYESAWQRYCQRVRYLLVPRVF